MKIDPEIERAFAPPGGFYGDPDRYRQLVDRVLAKSWSFVARSEEIAAPGSFLPVTAFAGSLDEPLILARDAGGTLRAISNACTHRGHLVAREPGRGNVLRCGYHGRRFDLSGRCLSMPCFEGVEGFPAERDRLAEVAVAEWGPLVFASLAPAVPFEAIRASLEPSIGFALGARLEWDPTSSRDYTIDAHFALYLDNYLEGFHIPFVHPSLAGTLDLHGYRTELFPQASLQIGPAKTGEVAHALPAGHPHAGERIAGYYAWLFPTTMLNLYPWGLSLNVVEPLGPTRTRVRYLAFVADPSLRQSGAGSGLDRVEAEDQAVVLAAQRGVRSRLYPGGRYSPSEERGVHHFHRLLAEALA